MVSAGAPTYASDLNDEIAEIDTMTGAWTAYTPTILNWVIGNGTLAGRYRRSGVTGKTFDFDLQLVFGSTTTTAGGNLLINFPTAIAGGGVVQSATLQMAAFTGHAIDVSVGVSSALAHFEVSAKLDTAFRIIPFRTGQFMTTTAPFTWATGDILRMSGRGIELN